MPSEYQNPVSTMIFSDGVVAVHLPTPLAIGTVDHNLHRIRRAAISPLFTNRAILKMEPALQEHADLLVRDLKGRRGEIIDIRVYFFAWTTEFFTSHIFQSRTNLFWNAGPAWEWYNVMIEFTRKFALVKHFPWLVSTGMALPLVFWQVFVPSLASVISVHKVCGLTLPHSGYST